VKFSIYPTIRSGYSQIPFWFLPTFCALFIIYTANYLGIFSSERISLVNGPREFNAAYAIPTLSLYFWLAIQITKKRAKACLTEFAKQNTKLNGNKNYCQDIESQYQKNLRISCILGMVITLIYLSVEDLLATDFDSIGLFLNIIAVPFWSFSCLLFLQLLFITHFTIKHFLGYDKIDLFGIKKLMPVSEMVITNSLVSAFGLILIPLFWIGKTIPNTDKIIVTLVFILISCYLFWPILRVQKVISNKKKLAINRINSSFENLFDDKLLGERRLTDDPTRLRKLSSLISAKQEIANASEWPFDLPQRLKGLLLIVSIPLSWAAASLVETLIVKLQLL
jgi:hypothetical protein